MDGAVSPAPSYRPANTSADPEMVAGWSFGGRHLVGDEGGDPTRSGSFALDGQHLPALCFRPVGGSLAEEVREGARHSEPLRGRHRHGFRAPGRSGTVSQGSGRTTAEIRPRTTPGQDAPD